MRRFFRQVWLVHRSDDIAEFSVMMAVVLVIAVGTLRLISSNAGHVFSQIGPGIR